MICAYASTHPIRPARNRISSDDVRRQGTRELGGRADLDAVLAASRPEVPGVAGNHGVRNSAITEWLHLGEGDPLSLNREAGV